MNDLVLFGIQGSGKGTQGKIIAKKYGLEIFETGALLRKLSSEESSLGKKIKSIIESGQLVSNEVVMEIIENFMQSLTEGKTVLFDGIPRKIEQANTFQELMKKLNRNFKGVYIHISKKEALKRLTSRRICKDCKEIYPASYPDKYCEKCKGELINRSDDNIESIKTRLEAYDKETIPVINRYKEEDKMIEVNGEQEINKVTEELYNKLDKQLNSI